uniref:C-type lectin domain-containing protein n=1 Tax=Oryzias latipes TaxID=8090 RepID=A0A3P9J5J4_ORYLA
ESFFNVLPVSGLGCLRILVLLDGGDEKLINSKSPEKIPESLIFLFFSPAGWLRFKNKCFLFKGKKNDIKGNWSYARNWCKEQGGDLAIIDDQYENGRINFVTSYLKDLEHPAWIGLSDLLAENQYAWSDGVSPVLYTHWDNNEPNNVGGTEHCVTMNHNMLMSGKWNDDACHKNHSFVCYRKKCR